MKSNGVYVMKCGDGVCDEVGGKSLCDEVGGVRE